VARDFWAVTSEDEQTSFDTSIDVEFDSGRQTPEYDGFDVQNAVRTNTQQGPSCGASALDQAGQHSATRAARASLIHP